MAAAVGGGVRKKTTTMGYPSLQRHLPVECGRGIRPGEVRDTLSYPVSIWITVLQQSVNRKYSMDTEVETHTVSYTTGTTVQHRIVKQPTSVSG